MGARWRWRRNVSSHEDLLVLVEVAAELVEPEDVAVFAREFAQFAVELAERPIGFDEAGHLQVLSIVMAGIRLRWACGGVLRPGRWQVV